VLESLNLVLVVGLAVDYVVHLAEGYSRSAHSDRLNRLRDALEEVGISVLSGALTTLGASMFLLIAHILFFSQFGIFMFSTIGLSILYALGFFTTMLGIMGPQNEFGSLKPLYRWCGRACGEKCCKSKGSAELSS
jgi:predicted RND superfamily exporter protein